jgi:hypothetical protein
LRRLKRSTKQTIVTPDEFRQLVRPLCGLTLSRVWRGYASALFLEIGPLSDDVRVRSDGTRRVSKKGQFGVMIQWGWRVERSRSIWFGSGNTQRIIDNRLPLLEGMKLVNIEINGRLPEIVIELSDARWIHSFSPTQSQPEWCVFLDREQKIKEWLISLQGKIVLESPL